MQMKMGLYFDTLPEIAYKLFHLLAMEKYYNATVVIYEVSTLHIGMVLTQDSRILSSSLQYILEEWKGVSFLVGPGMKSENKKAIGNGSQFML